MAKYGIQFPPVQKQMAMKKFVQLELKNRAIKFLLQLPKHAKTNESKNCRLGMKNNVNLLLKFVLHFRLNLFCNLYLLNSSH